MILVQKIQIPALPTKKPRRLYIYLPRDYPKNDTRYPVLYMFDGHNVFYDSHATYGKSWGMKEYLEKTRLPIILVAVECNHEGYRRISEYSPWDEKAPRPIGAVQGLGNVTMDWITKELKPMIDRTYRTIPDREHTLIAGSSMGGIMSIYAAVVYNEVFSKAAALSPVLWYGQKRIGEMISSHPLLKPTQIYLDYGEGEAEKEGNVLEDLFSTARKLTKAGAVVDARVVPGALHSEAYWEQRIPVFMPYLLGTNK